MKKAAMPRYRKYNEYLAGGVYKRQRQCASGQGEWLGRRCGDAPFDIL